MITYDLEVAHPQSGSLSTWFLVELEFGNVGFWGEGKIGVPEEKPLGAKERTNNKLNPHMALTPAFEPGPHWCETSTLTTGPSLATQKAMSLLMFHCGILLFSVASLTHLCVICRHFFCAMSLFQGHVACQYICPNRLCTTSAKTCWNYLPYKPSLIPPSMSFWIHSTLGFRP